MIAAPCADSDPGVAYSPRARVPTSERTNGRTDERANVCEPVGGRGRHGNTRHRPAAPESRDPGTRRARTPGRGAGSPRPGPPGSGGAAAEGCAGTVVGAQLFPIAGVAEVLVPMELGGVLDLFLGGRSACRPCRCSRRSPRPCSRSGPYRPGGPRSAGNSTHVQSRENNSSGQWRTAGIRLSADPPCSVRRARRMRCVRSAWRSELLLRRRRIRGRRTRHRVRRVVLSGAAHARNPG